jgi:hypothetical protein
VSSLTVYCENTANGRTRALAATYPPNSDGGSTTGGSTGQRHDGSNYNVYEYFFSFDLSELPADATVDAATLSMKASYVSAVTFTDEVYVYDWSTTVSYADHRLAAALTTLYDSGNGLFASVECRPFAELLRAIADHEG